VYFAIASDDNKREPEVKNTLKEAFAATRLPAVCHGQDPDHAA